MNFALNPFPFSIQIDSLTLDISNTFNSFLSDRKVRKIPGTVWRGLFKLRDRHRQACDQRTSYLGRVCDFKPSRIKNNPKFYSNLVQYHVFD
jgi:hypothetical protein